MSEMDEWTAAQFQDELQRMKETLDALELARKAGTPAQALETLAYEAGVAEQYRKAHP